MLDDTHNNNFDADNAMRLHKRAQAGAMRPTPRMPSGKTMGYIFWAVVVWVVLAFLFGNKDTPKAVSTQASANASGPTESNKNTLAAMINLHGELCATVTGVDRIEGDVYRISCVRYRDGTDSAVYEVNARTGTVK